MQRKLAWLLLAFVTLVLTVFSVQNAALVDYRFLTWQVEVRRSAVVAICTMIGFTVGWLMGASRRRKA